MRFTACRNDFSDKHCSANPALSKMPQMKIQEISAKSVLSESQVYDYAMNPYRGCSHACRYCYAAFMKRFFLPNIRCYVIILRVIELSVVIFFSDALCFYFAAEQVHSRQEFQYELIDLYAIVVHWGRRSSWGKMTARSWLGAFEQLLVIQLDRQKREKKGLRPYHAFSTTVCATRSPRRCFLSEVQIRIAPSRYGITHGMASISNKIVRIAASP